MKIVHKIDDFLYSIFPEIEGKNQEQLVKKIEEFYTFGPCRPKVTLHDDWVTVEIDTSSIVEQENDYKRVVSLCEKGRFSEAKPILSGLIEKNPTVSEYHRIMGQILSEQGNHDEGINCLIDALRWNPKNGWALLMMGNIFAKHKNDIDTAMKYYDQALKVNPKDNISVNNIGANLMQQGRTDEAKKYFKKALEIDSSYPNTHYALAMVSEIEGNLKESFDFALEAIRHASEDSQIFNHSMSLALKTARRISQSDEGRKIYLDYK